MWMSSSCKQDVFGFGGASDSRLNLQIKPLDIATTIEYRVANSSALLVILFIDITKVTAGQRTGGFLMQSVTPSA